VQDSVGIEESSTGLDCNEMTAKRKTKRTTPQGVDSANVGVLGYLITDLSDTSDLWGNNFCSSRRAETEAKHQCRVLSLLFTFVPSHRP